jgi:hypothetical protein
VLQYIFVLHFGFSKSVVQLPHFSGKKAINLKCMVTNYLYFRLYALVYISVNM